MPGNQRMDMRAGPVYAGNIRTADACRPDLHQHFARCRNRLRNVLPCADDADRVLIHDAARPLLTAETVSACLAFLSSTSRRNRSRSPPVVILKFRSAPGIITTDSRA